MESSCRASLMWSSSSSCNVLGYRTTSDEIDVKSRQANLCIYSRNIPSAFKRRDDRRRIRRIVVDGNEETKRQSGERTKEQRDDGARAHSGSSSSIYRSSSSNLRSTDLQIFVFDL
ncbi:hypothetical protein U1Q18_038718 [Sarracenia purpurea var. burkii]